MSSERFTELESVQVDTVVVRDTLALLQAYGARGCEGLVLWLGAFSGRGAHVTHAFVPEQQAIRSESGIGYFVDGAQLFALNRALDESGLRLIAQVHSHPGRAYHSDADDRYAIVTAEGGFSLVVPNFGSAPADPSLWAVYRLCLGKWHRVPAEAVHRLFRLREDVDQ